MVQTRIESSRTDVYQNEAPRGADTRNDGEMNDKKRIHDRGNVQAVLSGVYDYVQDKHSYIEIMAQTE